MCTVHDKLSCTRLQNYTIVSSLKSVSVSVSVPWNSSLSWTGKSPDTPDTHDLLRTSSRGCHGDVTWRTVPWNLSFRPTPSQWFRRAHLSSPCTRSQFQFSSVSLSLSLSLYVCMCVCSSHHLALLLLDRRTELIHSRFQKGHFVSAVFQQKLRSKEM